ncbi:MFS transporter [Amycolatopsis sp. YIM 10]|uniref:MFS transporter n=1 Tax=Amycolatopsis sp. YIM 10 TaxID=2653857 RepID=UPI00128FD25D|nr:MFS transporter [Amycolatopsis sp. YIM 10]QFU87166.1 Major Facilitator Superfamily protein [Amycolatopsis sp. YIM 10]
MSDGTTARPALSRGGLRRVLATLCLTEVTSWGVLYYAFPVLATDIARSTGWSLPWTTAGFSAGQLTAALAGIPVGRWLDRHGPRGVMSAGSVLGVPAVVLIAVAPDLGWFIAAWVVAGVAMGATLYPPAFAALTRWYGPDRVKALTVLTLAGGLASTVFAPLTAALVAHLDWRETYLVLAAILAVVTIPGHLFGLRGHWPDVEPGHAETVLSDPGRIARSRAFLALTAALGLTAFGAFAAVVNLVPLLTERGVGTGVAAVALGLGGAGQVLGRLGFSALVKRTGVRTRTVLVLLLAATTTAALGVVTSIVALIGVAIVAGMARGVFTLLQATAITDRWGAAHYGRLTGLLSAPLTITMAFAPWAGAALAGALGGYSSLFLVLGVITAFAAVISLAGTPPNRRIA